MGKSANASIPLSKIKIQDKFWNKYANLVKKTIIPYQWKVLNDQIKEVETSHCIENFKIAAGESEGIYEGVVFQDTDVAKWLEAVGFVLSWERDEQLEELADETIDLIGKAQQENGYLNTYFTIKEPKLRWTNLMEGHELYTAGHMIEAAVAYYEATGKEKFLRIVSKLADLICNTFGLEEGKLHGYPGHQEIELALIKLYRVTGVQRYLDMAKYFIDNRGVGENYFLKEETGKDYKRIFPEFDRYDPKYSQSHQPVREQQTAEGHAVRATYMYCAMADLAYEYEDLELLQTCDRLWENIVQRRMYLTGGIGSSGLLERFTTDYDLPNDINYSETCASIGLALFGKRMADIKKDASYMDIVERALYNTVLSGIAIDGKSFFYVNPLEVWPKNCIERTSREHVKPVRQKWFGVACCPPNIARTLASLGQYIYFQEKDEVYINLFIANETKIEIDKIPIVLKAETEFPWKNEISFYIAAAEQVKTKFYFRIPDYAKDYQIYYNGVQIKYEIKNGYAKVERVFWKDQIRIIFESSPRFLHANPKVRQDSGKIALVKGPLVYCLEEFDNGENLASIYVDPHTDLKETWEKESLGGFTAINFKGYKILEENWKETELYKETKIQLKEITLKAIPYCYWNNRKPGEMIVWLKELVERRDEK